MAGGSVPPGQGQLFQQAGAQFHIPPAVLAGIASVETNLGQNHNTSSAGAQGEMQFMPGTARGLGVNPYNTRQAIFGAAKLLNQYGFQQNPLRAIGAYNGGPGNPQYGYAHQVMSEAQRLAGQLGGGIPAGGLGGASAPGGSLTTTTVTPSSTDYNAAGLATLLAAANKPISTSGKFTADNLLSNLAGAAASGKYTTPGTASSVTVSQGGQDRINLKPGQGDVNPLPGWTIGRTDMGVDASTKPGTPIRAMNDMKVVGILPNWYHGQPYLWAQLTAGPNKGKFMYVAEQIDHLPKVGQVIPRGAVLARYAPTGTGIEIGWGTPTWETRAQATGQLGDVSHGNAPAGVDFAKLLQALRS